MWTGLYNEEAGYERLSNKMYNNVTRILLQNQLLPRTSLYGQANGIYHQCRIATVTIKLTVKNRVLTTQRKQMDKIYYMRNTCLSQDLENVSCKAHTENSKILLSQNFPYCFHTSLNLGPYLTADKSTSP
jgi:hypothetical protein